MVTNMKFAYIVYTYRRVVTLDSQGCFVDVITGDKHSSAHGVTSRICLTVAK